MRRKRPMITATTTSITNVMPAAANLFIGRQYMREARSLQAPPYVHKLVFSALVGECNAQFLERHRCGGVHVRDARAVYMVVENIALLRSITRLTDLVAELCLAGTRAGSRGRDDVLLDHDRAHIVRPKSKCGLAEL